MLEISTKSNNYLKMNVYAKNAELEGDSNLKTKTQNQESNQENNLFGEAVSLELSNEYVTEKSSYEDMLRESKVQRTLKQGSKGNDVKTLQSNLNYLGYNVGTADGVFGAKTKNAVIAYQRAHGLEVDGIAGPATQNSIASSVVLKKAAEVTKNLGVLQHGSKGEAVVKLQKNLVALGYNPKGTDGIFGADTKAAVMLFQEVCGLTADGVAGKNTNDAINRALNNKNAGALSRGLISGEVTSLQNNLKTLGFYSGSLDGIYGAGTESAVRNFQRAHGLSQDGVAGAGTKQTIATALAAKAAAEAAEKAARENGVLQRGSKGDAVVRLQKNLNALGYDTKGADGIYGNDTRTAVMKFQEVYGLTVDGVVGKETADAINGAIAHKNAGELSRGMVSEDVKTFQFNMKALQYYSGVADGVYGSGTVAAVKKLQKENGLKEDGVVSKAVRLVVEAALKTLKSSSASLHTKESKDFIKKEEGLRLTPDKVGGQTIGYGFDRFKYPDIKVNYDSKGGITKEEADRIFDIVYEKNAARLDRYISEKGYHLDKYQYAAAIDLIYNRGVNPTTKEVIDALGTNDNKRLKDLLLNDFDYRYAIKELNYSENEAQKYVNRNPGLPPRRQREYELVINKQF